MRSSSLLQTISLFLVLGAASSCKGCHRGHADADAAADAAPDTGVAAVDEAGADAAPMASAAPSADPSAAPADAHSATAVSGAAGGPFQGTYHCLTGGLRLTQNGAHVSGVSGGGYNPKLSHAVWTFSCTVSGDECKGSGTEVVMKDGKSLTAKPETKPVSIKRNEGYVGVHLGDFAAPCKRE